MVQEDLSTDRVLAMSFVPGLPIDMAASKSQEIRNSILTRLARLALDELFAFGFVQTDPNFANYSYEPDGRTIGLLDFGAAKEVSPDMADLLRQLLAAGLEENHERLSELSVRLGLYNEQTSPRHRELIDQTIGLVFEAVLASPSFDFANDQLPHRLRAMGTDLALDPGFNQIPPIDLLYLQRKAAGLYLLGRRLRAQLPLRDILEEYAQEPVPERSVRND